MDAKYKHNLKFMQCIPTKLEPDVRNTHSTRTPWSIPLKRPCCRLLKHICRLQVENDRKLPCVSQSLGVHSTQLSLGSEKSLCHWRRGEWKLPFGGLHVPKHQTLRALRTGMVPNSLHLQTRTVWIWEALLQNHPKKKKNPSLKEDWGKYLLSQSSGALETQRAFPTCSLSYRYEGLRRPAVHMEKRL